MGKHYWKNGKSSQISKQSMLLCQTGLSTYSQTSKTGPKTEIHNRSWHNAAKYTEHNMLLLLEIKMDWLHVTRMGIDKFVMCMAWNMYNKIV